jgi:hypothetical protein
MNTTLEISAELKNLIKEAYYISKDAGKIVEESLKEAIINPISPEEAEILLKIVIEKLKEGAISRGDDQTASILDKNWSTLIKNAMETRQTILNNSFESTKAEKVLSLSYFNGLKPGPVHPRPTFHRIEIPMNSGGVKTTDIILWENNERLDIHVNQFRSANRRNPNSSELLDIMLSKMPLQGLAGKDQFKIEELARSIANNGVRKPPIIAKDGTLLDGNRRVAACYFILNSDEFDSEQKKRAEYIFVWQLTEHATADDKNAVVVSLNFEPDNKQDWPEYVKAKIIYEKWQSMLALEINNPGQSRIAQMKRELSSQFGYGTDPYMVNRYIKMVDWAIDFEDYQVNENNKNEFEVKHRASKHFQYFDELSKGATPGGVAYTLNQDEPFKHLVYDLLFQNKFKNWTIIRNLRYYNEDVRDAMIKARDMNDEQSAQDLLEDKLNEAKAQKRESRIGNPNQRIEVFAEWLEALPISAFRDIIQPNNLLKLQKALELVNKQISDLGV